MVNHSCLFDCFFSLKIIIKNYRNDDSMEGFNSENSFGETNLYATDNENRVITHFIDFVINKTGFIRRIFCC